MKKYLIYIFILFSIFKIDGEIFKFKFIPGDKYKVTARIKGDYYENRVLFNQYHQIYKTINTVKAVQFSLGQINDFNFYYIIRDFGYLKIRQIERTGESNYSLAPSGLFHAEEKKDLPTNHNMPYFPDQDLKVGDTWTMSGSTVQDLFNDGFISEFPVEVAYQFTGYDDQQKNIAIITYQFSFDLTNSQKYKIHPRVIRAAGQSKTTMYFNIKKGRRVKEEYDRNFGFIILQDNSVQSLIQFKDGGFRAWTPVEKMDKDRIEKRLKNQVEKEKLDDVEVGQDEHGVKLVLENIQFDPDSAHLRDSEKDRLIKIAKILKKYKNHEIMIKGHTTDKGTIEGREKLSYERARKVTEFLLTQKALDPEKTSYYGVGGQDPIASNKTEAGMKKNRRVEIYLLEE